MITTVQICSTFVAVAALVSITIMVVLAPPADAEHEARITTLERQVNDLSLIIAEHLPEKDNE